MNIGKFKFSNPIFLSPMAGVGDFAFRAICREFGADLSYTEMLSVKSLIYNSEKSKSMLHILSQESPNAIQLFGSIPQDFYDALLLPELDKFDIIDLNFGCPAPKIVKNGEGSALLKNYLLMQNIVSNCKQATSRPLGAKIRLGFNKIDYGIANILEDAGVDYITLHGRTADQGYSGVVNYDAIASIKSRVKIPVVGNGDITDFVSLEKMRETGVDAVSLARGALGREWIFWELKNRKNFEASQFEIIRNHTMLLRSIFDDEFLTKYLRKHYLWYLKGKYQPELKIEICKMNDLEFILSKLEKVF